MKKPCLVDLKDLAVEGAALEVEAVEEEVEGEEEHDLLGVVVNLTVRESQRLSKAHSVFSYYIIHI